MTGLVEFLLARIAEDEATARYCLAYVEHYPTEKGFSHAWDWALLTNHTSGGYGSQFMRIEGFSPERFLAECDAKRRLIEWARPWQADVRDECLRLIALPYADHPDFDPAWRV